MSSGLESVSVTMTPVPCTEPGTYTMTSKLFITKSNQVFEPPGEQELGFCFFPVSGAHLASLSVYIQKVV